VFEFEIVIEASFFPTSQSGAMLAMPPKEPVSSTVVQHSDSVSNTHIRRVDHHAEIPRESYVELTPLERTSTALTDSNGQILRSEELKAGANFDDRLRLAHPLR
jgi:hypothetical protein